MLESQFLSNIVEIEIAYYDFMVNYYKIPNQIIQFICQTSNYHMVSSLFIQIFPGNNNQLMSLFYLLYSYNFSQLSSSLLQNQEHNNLVEQDNSVSKVVETIQIVKSQEDPNYSHNHSNNQGISRIGVTSNFQNAKNKKYVFCSEKKTKERRVKKHQNRNIIPNSIHQILSYVQKRHKSGPYLEKIFRQICSNDQWSIQRYYSYQKLLRDKMHNYMKETSLQILTTIYEPHSEFYSYDEQNFYMKLARILAKRYLDKQSIPMFLNCKRMGSTKKIQHLKNRRYLLERIGEIFREI